MCLVSCVLSLYVCSSAPAVLQSLCSPARALPHPPIPSSPHHSVPPHSQVIQLAFLVACMYTGVGLLRLGFMVRFLSHSVITGFTSGVERKSGGVCVVG